MLLCKVVVSEREGLSTHSSACREDPEGNVCVNESGRCRNLRKDGFCCFTARKMFLVQEMDEDKMNVANGIHVRKDKYVLSFG